MKRDSPGFYLSPALFVDTTNAMRISREEIFGPVANVIRVRDYEEALAVSNDTPMGLTAGIATTSLKYATHFKRHARGRYGHGQRARQLASTFTCRSEGARRRAYGPREQGRYAAEFYTTVKTAYTSAG